MTSRRFVFDWQIWLWALAAGLGWLIAYDTQRATLTLLLVGLGLMAYLVMANLPDPLRRGSQSRSLLAGILALLPVVVAAYFFLTNDWARSLGKIGAFDPVLRLLAAWPLSTIGLGANPNVIGGVIAALLPLQIFALRQTRRWLAVLLIGLSLVTLLFTQTRGAWLSLLFVSGMWLLWRTLTRRLASIRRARLIWLGSVLVVGVVCAAILILTPLGDRLLGLGGDRARIWQNSTDLIGDYALTGLGLGGFEMAYSTYALLVHVGHTLHAHNLWLDIWLNLGFLGVVALAGLIVNAVWPRPNAAPWRMAALMTLGVLLLHTLVDDSLLGYGGVGLPVLFIPLGLLIRSEPERTAEAPRDRPRWQPAFAVWGAALIGLIATLILPQGRALLEVNLGALQQPRQELSAYRWPDVPIQDALRHDLAAAEQHYQAALNLDPNNAAANRRLGQIELANQRYAAACQHFAGAFAASPQQRATRQLLGECAALDGQIDRAVALWRTLDLGQGQLYNRQYWYADYLHDPDRSARLNAAINSLPSQ